MTSSSAKLTAQAWRRVRRTLEPGSRPSDRFEVRAISSLGAAGASRPSSERAAFARSSSRTSGSEDGKGQLVLPLERVDLREVQLGPEKAGIQPDGFLEELGAFLEPVLLDADGAEHRTGRGARRGIGERELGLLVGFLEPPFLDEGGRPLQGRLCLRAEAGGRQQTAQEHDRKTAARSFPGDAEASREGRTSVARVPTSTRLPLQ